MTEKKPLHLIGCYLQKHQIDVLVKALEKHKAKRVGIEISPDLLPLVSVALSEGWNAERQRKELLSRIPAETRREFPRLVKFYQEELEFAVALFKKFEEGTLKGVMFVSIEPPVKEMDALEEQLRAERPRAGMAEGVYGLMAAKDRAVVGKIRDLDLDIVIAKPLLFNTLIGALPKRMKGQDVKATVIGNLAKEYGTQILTGKEKPKKEPPKQRKRRPGKG